MVRLLAAWGAAAIMWLVGFAVVGNLAAGSAANGGSLSDFDRLTRLDLPWIVISVLMVVAAGAVRRDRTNTARWLAGVLPIPLLATAVGLVAPLGGDGDALSTVMYLVEGVAGAAIGLPMAALVSVKGERRDGYW